MVCKMRDFAAALLMAAAAADAALGQCTLGTPVAAGVEVPAMFAGQAPVAVPSVGMPTGTAAPSGCAGSGAVGHCNPNEDNNGKLLWGDPLLDNPCWGGLGWFAAAETDLVGAHIKNELTNQVTVGAATNTVHLPTANLDWTVAPRFEVGYRFGEGAGELLLAYKFLVTSGSATIPDFDTAGNPGNLHSELNINAWDLDYGSREISLLPNWDLKWRAGVRLEAVYFDSEATSALMEQRVTNYFVGAGPHFGLDLRRLSRGTGLELFGRVEAAFVIGETTQSFDEVNAGVGGATHPVDPLISPWLGVQAGVGWTPPNFSQFTLSAGYAFECWWSLADADGSRGDITSQGVFFRAEIRY